MRRAAILLILMIFLSIGCATVRMKAPKEPIKVDISMRLDVYQHVQKDIDAIENIVSGSDDGKNPSDEHSFLSYFVGTVYAQDLSPAVENAAQRRGSRRTELVSLQRAGVVGEGASGLAVVRKGGDPSADGLVRDENKDRMTIYRGIAAKNNVSVSDIQKVYAERLQRDASSGTPIETSPGSWKIK
jgi:uncharacterized protein YdbL (DUF1318 family)